MTTDNIALGNGINLGSGIALNPPTISTVGLQNVTGSPSNTGFFFATLNRGYADNDYFADNGNNGSWTASGDFGQGNQTISVTSLTHDADSLFPVLANNKTFIPGNYYSFHGH